MHMDFCIPQLWLACSNLHLLHAKLIVKSLDQSIKPGIQFVHELFKSDNLYKHQVFENRANTSTLYQCRLCSCVMPKFKFCLSEETMGHTYSCKMLTEEKPLKTSYHFIYSRLNGEQSKFKKWILVQKLLNDWSSM